jgi:hypothetical protein
MVKWSTDRTTAERIGKNAFQDYPADRLEEVGAPAVAVSVFLTSCFSARGLSWDDVRRLFGEEYGVALIEAGAARGQGQGITRGSTQESSHAMIFAKSGAQKTRAQQASLAASAVLVHPPAAP